MAKKSTRAADNAAGAANGGDSKHKRGEKSQAIRDYFGKHKNAMPKEVVAALKEQRGLTVSPNMVSMLKAKLGIKKAKRKARQAVAANHASAGAQVRNAAGLDAALTLYKAAREQSDVPASKIRQSFLVLVELLG